jgi:HPt (histidine-containing phosphotransfer) domain-containing protein
MQDLGLDAQDLYPLMQTLVSDLNPQVQQLQALLHGPLDAQTLHRPLHALKGVAGLFAHASLLQAITQADDASRSGHLDLGRELSEQLLPRLNQWLADAQAWLQRYSST